MTAPSHMTSATFMSSDGWNWNGPSAIQFVFPPTSMPSGIATTRSWRRRRR